MNTTTLENSNATEDPGDNHTATQLSCSLLHQNFSKPVGEIWCSWAWDSMLCWPPTKASSWAERRCPRENGIDPTKFVKKKCGENGRWEGRSGIVDSRGSTVTNVSDDWESEPFGWTNYTPCFTPEMWGLWRKLHTGDENAAEMKLAIAEKTRSLEIVGFSVSLVALLVSLTIFCYFRSLRNTRTRIHKNLFVAMVIQVAIRLTLYIDQALVRPKGSTLKRGIENTPFLCEAAYILLEYARTAMFMWMFIEGLYLHNIVTVAVFQETSYYRLYRLAGWGYPVLMTLTWAVITAFYYHPAKCWWGYNFTLYFWILEGPRLAVILLNFLFLLNIVRVLIIKLRQSRTSEMAQIWKAVRATVVLLPLLGITNLMSMVKAPLDKAAWEFALWSYLTHFLTSFQGLFVASLYCFLNGEVRNAVSKSISMYLSSRVRAERTSRAQSVCSARHQHSLHPGNETRDDQTRRMRGGRNWFYLYCKGDNTPASAESAEARV